MVQVSLVMPGCSQPCGKPLGKSSSTYSFGGAPHGNQPENHDFGDFGGPIFRSETNPKDRRTARNHTMPGLSESQRVSHFIIRRFSKRGTSNVIRELPLKLKTNKVEVEKTNGGPSCLVFRYQGSPTRNHPPLLRNSHQTKDISGCS